MSQAVEAMYLRWSTNWTSSVFAFEGEAHSLDEGVVPWALLGVAHEPRGDDGQQTLGRVGSRRYKRQGRLWVQLSVLESGGRQPLDGLGHTARGIFEGVSFSGIRFFDATFRETGKDGKWLQGMLEAEFDYQEIK